MPNPLTPALNGKRGQSLTEFAISLTAILIMLAVLVDAGRALFTYLAMRDAAQEGAAYAAVNPSNLQAIEARVCSASNLMSGICNEIVVSVSPTVSGKLCMGSTGGQTHGVIVTVRFPRYRLVMPLIGQFISRQDGTIEISASALDTILTPPCP